jgi:hypothetical protein
MRRRTFLQTASTAAVAAMSPAAEPVPIKLGFDSYSIRAFQWKAIQLLDYAAGLKLDTVQLSSLGDYESLEPAYLQAGEGACRARGRRDRRGHRLHLPVVARLQQEGRRTGGIRRARAARGAAVGSRVMRCYMGTRDNRRTALPLEAHMENTVKVLRAVRSQALDAGVRIAVENHAGDMQAREVKALIEEAGKDFVGSCLDTGNPCGWSRIRCSRWRHWRRMWPPRTCAIARSSSTPRRGRAMGRAGRRLGGFRALRRGLSQAVPGGIHTA